MDRLYPPGPREIPAALTQPSKDYKRHALWAVASLLGFAAIYFALAGWFCWTAYRMLKLAMDGADFNLPMFMVGVCAAFLALFMLKALFFVRKGGAPDDMEVTATQEPQLFAFLHQLADEAGAPRPQRVFLSARVNAAVFYDLSILNFFFPSRKNLEIGLALVNVLTLSEMKAVLAHEFGHFAQRSMAIGNWVYIAQQIAAHVVAKRDALDKFLAGLSRVDFRIAWVGWLLSLIVWSIRSLMDSFFRIVLLAQRALSRQMEFQADLVAVSLTGSDELIHALHKLQAADEAWSRALNFANSEARQGRAIQDMFKIQSRIIERTSRILDDADYGRIPASTQPLEKRRLFSKGFAQPPQMWSTHPANADREENAKRHYLSAPHDERSAWLLFSDASALRLAMSTHLFKGTETQPAEDSETDQHLEKRYALAQYNPAYRGAYLGRTFTRHFSCAPEIYETVTLADQDMQKALTTLYPESLREELASLRTLEEELGTLKALRDKVYQANGGQIVYRGRVIRRSELPAAIRDVTQEADGLRSRILDHDRRCRATHLRAADTLGGGWKDYLAGLIDMLHYAEHTLADVQDAHGLLANVVAIVTADGKVSASELKRLIAVANDLHKVLQRVYAQMGEVRLDATLCARLDAESWSALLEEFKLGPASQENINDWMRVIDGWVSALTQALSSLASATLEQLLESEAAVATQLRQGSTPEAAAARSQVPAQYATLLPGSERKRQQKLDWWSRFQTADGIFPAGLRLLVAGGIVGAVLGFGGTTGFTTTVAVYNGLDTPVTVVIDRHSTVLSRQSGANIDVDHSGSVQIEARTMDGREIERFTADIEVSSPHYIYNISGASPLVEWTAIYGSNTEVPPRMLGAQRWLPSGASIFFTEPPERIESKSGGGTRLVVSGLSNKPPADLLRLASNREEALRMATAHAQWDDSQSPYHSEWAQYSRRLNQP